MPFISASDGDLKKVFITDAWLIEQYVGDRLWVAAGNTDGELGNNTVTTTSNFIQTVDASVTWKQVDNNYSSTLAIKTDGTLWAWGRNSYGQLGDNTITHRSSPVQTVAFGTNWRQVSTGLASSVAIKNDGTLWCWGDNASGELADNTSSKKSSPIQTVSFGNNWLQASIGYSHVGAVKQDGTLWMWGRNSYGQLGDNTIIHRSSPVQTFAGGSNWKQVSCTDRNTAGIKKDGTLWIWGANAYGQLGDNTTIDKSSPVQTIGYSASWKQVSFGYAHVGALKTDGTLWCWGRNLNGQIGDNSIVSKSSPVQTVAFGINWKAIDCGNSHSAAIKNDGSLWLWGGNSSGTLADGTTTDRSSPIQSTLGGFNWKQISCGSNTAAITNGN
jgi:alpha-tubulin suppressor-like RCC1 family protein